jgi:hypothetical protein
MEDMFTLFFLIQLVLNLRLFAFVMPATLVIAFREIETFAGFKYININWILGKI